MGKSLIMMKSSEEQGKGTMVRITRGRWLSAEWRDGTTAQKKAIAEGLGCGRWTGVR